MSIGVAIIGSGIFVQDEHLVSIATRGPPLRLTPFEARSTSNLTTHP